MDQQQLYLDLFKEYRSEIKHQELQRSSVSTICVAFAGAMIGYAYQKDLSAKPYIGLLLVNFSLIAILMLRKLYERFALGRKRAMGYLRAIDQASTQRYWSNYDQVGRLEKIWSKGREDNELTYDFISFVRLHHLWEALLIGSIFVGLAFVIVSGSKDCSFLIKFSMNLETPISERRLVLGAIGILGPLSQLLILRAYQSWQRAIELAIRKKEAPGHLYVILWNVSQLVWRCYEWNSEMKDPPWKEFGKPTGKIGSRMMMAREEARMRRKHDA